jgi:hypothetical protein
MNRREFCLSFGAAVAGGIAVCSPHRDTRSAPTEAAPVLLAPFRAIKVFPEQWREFLAFDSASEQATLLQESLRSLTANHTALVIASLSGLSPEFVKCLVTESLHVDRELYLPAKFPGEIACGGAISGLICTLQVTRQGIETAQSGNCPNDGFLFSLPKSRGMILCDASPGTWQTFLCQKTTERDDTQQGDKNLANLQTAQWLDIAQKQPQRV